MYSPSMGHDACIFSTSDCSLAFFSVLQAFCCNEG